jgi:hypothetical protein
MVLIQQLLLLSLRHADVQASIISYLSSLSQANLYIWERIKESVQAMSEVKNEHCI